MPIGAIVIIIVVVATLFFLFIVGISRRVERHKSDVDYRIAVVRRNFQSSNEIGRSTKIRAAGENTRVQLTFEFRMNRLNVR